MIVNKEYMHYAALDENVYVHATTSVQLHVKYLHDLNAGFSPGIFKGIVLRYNCEGDVLQASLQVLLNHRHYSPGAIMSMVEH